MKKVILTTFIIFSNSLFFGKTTPSSNPTTTNKGGSQISIDDLPPIEITPLYAPEIPDSAKPKKSRTERDKHSPHVQENIRLENKMASEGKAILTITYTIVITH